MSQGRDLFDEAAGQSLFRPLAERMRPKSLDQIVGHERYLGKDAVLEQGIKNGHIGSLLLWGPPGVGKTTLARVIAFELEQPLNELSAVSAGVKDVKEIIARARNDFSLYGRSSLLFIDEIHRFNKAQQDALLHATEQGIIILIGATTENPSFEVNAALLSRCTVLQMTGLTRSDLEVIIRHALAEDELLSRQKIIISGMEPLIYHSGGDARKLLNILEYAFTLAPKGDPVELTAELIEKAAVGQVLPYDKKSEYHYDTISAFIKSVRGSDPDAAVYWMARMLNGGEDPLFIARRLIILASEDIGNAEPYALSLANAAFDAVKKIGMPEARIILSQAVTYLASVPKSNAAYLAIDAALEDIKKGGLQPVPLHLRNAPTRLMKDLNYGAGYKYAHNFPGHFVRQEYLPEKFSGKIYYRPSDEGREGKLKQYLTKLWPRRHGAENDQ